MQHRGRDTYMALFPYYDRSGPRSGLQYRSECGDIQNNVSVYTGVTCEDDVFLGPSCVFTNVVNPRSAVCRRGEYAATRVGRGATIGANATVVCGHDIGRWAFVGAGAVITKDVPDYALVVGNPARQTGWMSRAGYRLEFGQDGTAVCPGTGEKYLLKDGKVTLIEHK